MEREEKPALEMRRDSGIACFTPSPPPKKSSLPRAPGGTNSALGHRELRRRLPSREMQKAKPSDTAVVPVEMPPRLDLRSLVGSDSDSDILSSSAASTDRTHRSDDCTNLELTTVAMETPPSEANSGMRVDTSTPDGYQSDIECSSASPAVAACPSPGSLGLSPLRRYGSGGLEEESEGSVLKVKLKIKSSDQENMQGEKGNVRGSDKGLWKQGDDEGHIAMSESSQGLLESSSAMSKYDPLPGIGHKGANPLDTVSQSYNMGQHDKAEVLVEEKENTQHLKQEELREQRLRALERCASQTEISMQKRVPMPPPQSAKTEISMQKQVLMPPPQSAKTVSRRAMRMQQFARRKSASQVEAHKRQTSLIPGSSQSGVNEADPCRSMLLAIRLPTGIRVQNIFKETDTLRTVALFAIQSDQHCSLDINRVCLVTNDMPKRVWTELALTIEAAEVRDRTLLHLEETD